MSARMEDRRAADRPATGRRGDRPPSRPYAPAPPRGGMARVARGSVVLAWLLVWAAATAAAATSIVPVDAPDWVAPAGGGVVTVLYVLVLAYRARAGAWLWTVLAAAATAAGLVYDRGWALSSVAVLAAVVSGVAAVLVTRPALTAWRSLVEYALALVVSAAGALAVAAIDAPVRPDRFSLVVVGVALVLAIGLVWQLGVGVHGLRRRGLAVVMGGAAVAIGLLAYTRALEAYGSPLLVERVDETVAWLADTLHGVPQPVEALVGFPALVFGIGARARRGRGWWTCAFGVLGTATVAASLTDPQLDYQLAAVSAAYSAVIGAVLGLLVRLWAERRDRAATRRAEHGQDGGRRALRRRGGGQRVQPEPGRTRPL